MLRVLCSIGIVVLLVSGCVTAVSPTEGVVDTPTPLASASATALPTATLTPTPPPTTAASATPLPPTSTATPPPSTATPAPTATIPPSGIGQADPRVEVVAGGLTVPWALAFAPDGRLFVTERPGRLRVIVNGQLRPEPIAELPVAAVGEGGLMGLALDPAFAQNGYLYLMYTYAADSDLRNRVVRYTLRGDALQEETVLLDNIPGARNHDGGRIAFGPDGKLYVTTGDAGQRSMAQQRDALAGKILRLNPDGSIPTDNPFPGSPVYSFGHRNPQGLAWQPGTGELFSTEHGPSGEIAACCHDELNHIRPGANYGWPTVFGAAGDMRFVDPVLESDTDTWAPAALVFYEGQPLAPWQGNAFFGALRGRHLHRVILDGQRVVADERLFDGYYGRIRAVAVGPDGYLYFAASNRDGRGSPSPEDDRILRIVALQ